MSEMISYVSGLPMWAKIAVPWLVVLIVFVAINKGYYDHLYEHYYDGGDGE